MSLATDVEAEARMTLERDLYLWCGSGCMKGVCRREGRRGGGNPDTRSQSYEYDDA